MMAAKLLVEEGDLKGISLSLENGDAWTIGRDPDECQLLIEDPLVSRKHLVARRTPEGIVVENLSETNPVLLNDEAISREPHLLQNGDTLKIGNEVLRFYEDSSAHVLDESINEINLFDDIDDPVDESNHLKKKTNEPTQKTENQPKEDKVTIPDPHSTPSNKAPEDQEEEDSYRHETIFSDGNDESHALAEIDFGVIETGRWLLKVIGGPNSGAEFYMQAGNSYVIGTDPLISDIVFHDTSVSRQHARISVTPEDSLVIEDLKSRNGVVINGKLIEEKQSLLPSTIVTVGTTSFVIYDREGEMQTIISPLMPSIIKVLQQESARAEELSKEALPQPEAGLRQKEGEPYEQTKPAEISPPAPPARPIGPYIVFSTIIALFALAGLGTTLLFNDEPVVMQTQENANELLEEALTSFPSVRWTFNKTNGSLLLLGHVPTAAEKNRLVYKLAHLKFIKNLDDNGIIIDEGVLGEVNSLIAQNPEWRGIRVYSTEAGQFILSGTLKTRKQAEQLSSYLSVNFPYLDMLKKQIVVEEDIMIQIREWLHSDHLTDITPQVNNGEVILTGSFPSEKLEELNRILGNVKEIPGVRLISNHTQIQTAETGIINLSDHYQVAGKSRLGDHFTVLINGHILFEGNDLDGMTITKISSNQILLQRDKDKFRIDY